MRKAATVILVKDNHPGILVYLLKRSTKSGFMGGFYVFPGGVVDPEDQGLDFWQKYIDLDETGIQDRFGDVLSNEEALAFCIAAIRETLEEAGVLIAHAENKTRGDFELISRYRLKQELGRSWFKDKMVEEQFVLKLSTLFPWSHWITPKLMKKRFDTRFFMVPMPETQECVTDDKETGEGLWLTPQKALELNLEGKIPLSPPTVVTLTQIFGFSNFKALSSHMENCGWGDPIAPRLVLSANGPVILEPWDPMWEGNDDVDSSDFASKTLEPGEKFSRIWCDKGLWKPVGV